MKKQATCRGDHTFASALQSTCQAPDIAADGSTVYVTSKHPVSARYIDMNPDNLIDLHVVMRHTAKGIRLKTEWSPGKGSMYLHENYNFFATRNDALEFIASEANQLAADLEATKLSAVRLMCAAQDAMRKEASK